MEHRQPLTLNPIGIPQLNENLLRFKTLFQFSFGQVSRPKYPNVKGCIFFVIQYFPVFFEQISVQCSPKISQL